ncbi:MAG: hypothetical protein M3434_08445 [Gemmatimonadota bacterium]|nr:hypothetical protein [Gemmatimonadota bacterium]
MPSPTLPLWFQRLPAELTRRLERAEAAAREARNETHAAQALELVAILAPRLPFDEAVDRYIEIMGLTGDEAEIVRTRALVLLSDPEVEDNLAGERHRGWSFDWRYATPLGALRYIRRHLRRNAEEDLWMELATARAEEALVRAHVEHALGFAKLLGDEAPPTRGISYYLNQLELPTARAHAVYQRALAQLAETYLPRLAKGGVKTQQSRTRV